MARVLLTGTPSRLAPVAERLLADGHVVRCAVPGGATVCEGAETIDATPDLPGGIVMALQGVAAVAWLLGDEQALSPQLQARVDALCEIQPIDVTAPTGGTLD